MRVVIVVLGCAAAGVLIARFMPRRVSEEAPNDGIEAARSARSGNVSLAPVYPSVRQSVRQRDLAASDPRYDPVVMMAQEQGMLRAHEVFELEPRDPKYAPMFEKRIAAELGVAIRELGLDDKVRAVHTECKTLSCSTRIEVAKDDLAAVYDAVNGVMLGDSQEPGMDRSGQDVGYVTITNLYRGDARSDAYHARFMAEAFEPALEAAKRRLEESLE